MHYGLFEFSQFQCLISVLCSGPVFLSFLPQSDFEENVVMLLYRERPELTVAK